MAESKNTGLKGGKMQSIFEKELQTLINKHSIENVSNTPDFILAQYLSMCLHAFETATQQRETWYVRDPGPSQPTSPQGKDREA